MNLRTSQEEPLCIDVVPAPPGEIGLTISLDKRGWPVTHGLWHRYLDIDMEVLRGWSPKIVIGLMEPGDYAGLGVVELPNRASAASFRYVSIAIPAGSAPDSSHNLAWREMAPLVHETLDAGGRVLIHCRVGLGQSGTLASMTLIERVSAPTRPCGECGNTEWVRLKRRSSHRSYGIDSRTCVPPLDARSAGPGKQVWHLTAATCDGHEPLLLVS